MKIHSSICTSQGVTTLEDPFERRRESVVSKRRASSAGLRQRTSASIVTQKTTLPQIETIKQRDETYQVRFKSLV